jgi:hypothetical protein
LKQIQITVSPEGETRIETKGFSGAECQAASRFVEQALGTLSAEQKTTEYYDTRQTDLRTTEQTPSS